MGLAIDAMPACGGTRKAAARYPCHSLRQVNAGGTLRTRYATCAERRHLTTSLKIADLSSVFAQHRAKVWALAHSGSRLGHTSDPAMERFHLRRAGSRRYAGSHRAGGAFVGAGLARELQRETTRSVSTVKRFWRGLLARRAQSVAANCAAWAMARLASSSLAVCAPPIRWGVRPAAVSASASSRRGCWPAQMTT